jgi:hypothetical protein
MNQPLLETVSNYRTVMGLLIKTQESNPITLKQIIWG